MARRRARWGARGWSKTEKEFVSARVSSTAEMPVLRGSGYREDRLASQHGAIHHAPSLVLCRLLQRLRACLRSVRQARGYLMQAASPKHVAISLACLGAQVWRYSWKTPSEIHAFLMVTCLAPQI